MNHYMLADLAVGHTESFTTAVTAEMLEKFRDVTGDVNILHNDEDYARAKGYPGRVVYGMLVASLYSTLAGVYLPGEFSLLHEVDAKFKKPVFVGDTLTVTGVVTEISETFGRIEIDARIVNQDGKTVNRGKILAGVTA